MSVTELSVTRDWLLDGYTVLEAKPLNKSSSVTYNFDKREPAVYNDALTHLTKSRRSHPHRIAKYSYQITSMEVTL